MVSKELHCASVVRETRRWWGLFTLPYGVIGPVMSDFISLCSEVRHES
jgi:hypothetical protein